MANERPPIRWRGGCENGHCVEVRSGETVVAMRDSADPYGPVLTFSRESWDAFTAAVRAGEFDVEV